MQTFLSVVLLTILTLSSSSTAQEEEYCNIGNAQLLNATQTFNTISVGYPEDCNTILAPATIHWHIFSLSPSGTAKDSRIYMSPPGLISPLVSDNTLQLFVNDLRNDGYERSDDVQAGVAIWVPAEQMESIRLSGVDETIQVVYNGTNPLTVSNVGVDNTVYLTSSNAPVHYRASGVDTKAQIETNTTGSTVVLKGVDSKASLAVPANDTLTVRMSAVGNTVMIDGGYESISMSGVDCEALVSTDCEGVEASGVGNECSVTNPVVVVDNLACVADTTIVKRTVGEIGFFLEHWGAIVGALVALFIIIPSMIVLLICCGCITCCVACGRRGKQQKGDIYTKDQEGMKQPVVRAVPARAWDLEQDGVDPHLVTAKTGTEPKTVDAGTYS